MQTQIAKPGFNGPGTPELRETVRSMPAAPFRRRSIRLPRAVRNDLGSIAAATKDAAEGDLKAGVTAVQRTLLHRATLGPSSGDYERIQALGYNAWLDEQLEYEKLDDSELEDALRASLPTLSMSPSRLIADYLNNPFIPVLELWTASVFRALYSPRQLFERMAIFWSDHFSIDIFAQPQPVLKPIDDRDVVRTNALGTFPDILSASAHSPAMLVFLTNDSNVRGHPNENYARELMELHTMGEDNGYSETDVRQVARCFTGWTVNTQYRNDGPAGTFRFRPEHHEGGAKKVLGSTVNAGGVKDGEQVLELLVARKETRDFIATKLLRYLWGYEPKKTAVRKVSKKFKQTGGDIRELVRTALSKQRMRGATPKLKRPFHLSTSALRAVGANVPDARFVLQALREAGHLPFDWAPPNGYPDAREYWSGFILPRWNFAAEMLDGGRGGVTIDPSLDDPNASVNAIANRIDEVVFAGAMTKGTRAEIKTYLNGGSLTRKRVREAFGLAVSSPEFQEY